MNKIKLPYWVHSRLGKKFGQIYSEIIITVSDENGKVVRQKKQVCESYLQNFAQLIYCNFKTVGSSPAGYGFTPPYTVFGMIDSLSTNVVMSNSYNDCLGVVNDPYDGIIIGTGAVSPTAQDRSLGGHILHGVGAGQMMYQGQSCANGVTTIGNVSSFNLLRTFVNNSGAPITVREMGLANFYTGTRYFLILRDLLSPAQVVNNAQTLTLNLITQITT